MKKLICIFFVMVFSFLICGCKNSKNDNVTHEQKMIIISSENQEEKSTNSIAKIEEMISTLNDINKLETIDDWIGACQYKIVISVDGRELTYMFGGKTFCDSDGKLYKVKNVEQTKEKIENIYNNISG